VGSLRDPRVGVGRGGSSAAVAEQAVAEQAAEPEGLSEYAAELEGAVENVATEASEGVAGVERMVELWVVR
jgi:hypothetical protein